MEHAMTLVVFTFLSQMAIGAFATLFYLDVYKGQVSKRSSFTSLVTIIIISLLAVVVSVFHLGHPFAAYRALLNFFVSWLSREIVFFPSFMLFVLLYTFVAKTRKQKQLFGWLAVILGSVTIFCTAMIYTIPSVPAWNNGTTVVSFFITSLITGPLLVQLMLSLTEQKLVNFNLYTTIVALLAIVLNILNITVLLGGFPAAQESANILLTSPLFWTKLIALVLAFFIAATLWIKKKTTSLTVISILFICFVIAEFLGRMMFYASGVHL